MSFMSSLSRAFTPLIGKTIRALARLRGGGSAFPGKVVEKIDPDFMARTLGQLPYGVVLVSGTNGKTTTTRIVASMLSSLGLRVFTNPTGSNFTRGVVSALLDEVDLSGKITADVAVLELDEAYAVHFVKQVKPRYSLLLNVLRDQLDRFGEIDTTARMLAQVAQATTSTVVLNREDPRISALSHEVSNPAQVRYFGLADELTSYFPSDDFMYEQGETVSAVSLSHYTQADVTLSAVDGRASEFIIDGQTFATDLQLEGIYNAFNAAGALAVVRAVMSDAAHDKPIDTAALIKALSTVTPAFGRGESIDIDGDKVELILVKNPMGFRLALQSFTDPNHATMIVINDEYADGRDMSWLWDVDFTGLSTQGDTSQHDAHAGVHTGSQEQVHPGVRAGSHTGVHTVSGVRATDMALRLAYDGVETQEVISDIPQALSQFVSQTRGSDKYIYCTYTAMLAVRKELSHITHVDDVGIG